MKTHKIYYHEYSGDGVANLLESPFTVEGVGYGLVSEYSVSPKDAIYSVCPAWKHRSNRNFMVRSPVDIDFSVNREEKYLISNSLTQLQFDRWFGPTFDDPNWCSHEKTTIQSTIPRFIFWTKSKNIWIEQKPHPLTSLRNNFITVGGWFNISNWNRPLSFAFDVVNTDQQVIIRRGDPVAQISFYSQNLDDGFVVQRAEPPDEIVKLTTRTSAAVSTFARKVPQDILNGIFQNKESKCPFHHLWKK